ncbi:MAG TPA: pilin [Candidatus Udaeobacter sp.]|nr:pilin [Candidatus Udaeobacter sp.]
MKKIILVLYIIGLAILPASVLAQTSPAKNCNFNASGQEICSLDNPLSSGTEATGIINVIIKGALGIIGALTLLMLIWGGFQWLTSAGNPEKVKTGTQTMVWAIIGVILVFSSYLLLSTFTDYLTSKK